MKYKVGDEVLVKATINDIRVGEKKPYAVKSVDNKFCGDTARVIYIREEDVFPVPDMTDDEAWEIAKKLFADYSNVELDEIFGKGWSFPKLMELTPQQAKAKIGAWEAEKEIKVGDEVEFDDTANNLHRAMYVTSKIGENDYCGICKNGDTYCVHKSALKKTGRHIDIERILKQIGGDERC